MEEIFNNLFIFEMANNHQGSLEHGLKIIKSMSETSKKYKIKAGVKLQYRNLDTFIHPDYKNRDDVKHIPRFLNTKLTNDDFYTLIKNIKENNLISIVTPFDEESVKLCVEHNVDIIKVASCSAKDWPLLEEISKISKPIIISTGGLKIPDIDKIVNFFTHTVSKFSLMHCVALYPVSNNNINLNFIDKLKRRYPEITIGYSGHESPDNYDIIKIAIGKGALIYERHVGYQTDTIKLNAYSMSPEETEEWIIEALKAQSICGKMYKQIELEEINSLLSLKRGVYASKNIIKGTLISKESVYFAMPCLESQIDSGEFGRKRIAITATRDYKVNEPIIEEAPLDEIINIREIIHEVKGMISEAGVALGKDFSVELSHHFGIENFRKIGITMINIFNREYCKKIIVQLPNQNHPNHMHKRKEETFQILWGDLTVNLNDDVIKMISGDILVIQRGDWHSFKTENGVIFEEISTTHFRDDSFYQDENISVLDPLQRKTFLETW